MSIYKKMSETRILSLLLCGILFFAGCSAENKNVSSDGASKSNSTSNTGSGSADQSVSETSASSMETDSSTVNSKTVNDRTKSTTAGRTSASSSPTQKTNRNPSSGDELKGQLTDGVSYTFMNYDTGRWLGIGSVKSFTVKKSDSGYMLMDSSGKKFLSFGTSLSLSANGTVFTLKHIENGLYTMESNSGKYLRDDDGGTTNFAAVTAIASGEQVSARWYITKASGKQPIRIMPVGDSITEGCNADIDPGEYVGYRYKLWKSLSQSGLRFVYVGSIAGSQTETDGLYRHEGHGGWTIDGTNGIANIVDRVNIKYCPDILLLQIGTNDCHLSAVKYGADTANVSVITEKLENLLKKIYKKNSRCTVFLAQIPPNLQGGSRNDWNIAYNNAMPNLVKKFSDSGNSITLVDNYTPMMALGKNTNYGLCTDHLHPSETGYTELAKSWSNAILKNSNKY